MTPKNELELNVRLSYKEEKTQSKTNKTLTLTQRAQN